ncbi:MAG: adenylate/guanylate cyclase domain-containing protein [Anaerolineae bacterium]|nr:MAG: adenylate/guanylate cyclase domain-containing protein [Anaerolineae bacterium]
MKNPDSLLNSAELPPSASLSSGWWAETVSLQLDTLRDQLRLNRLGLRFIDPEVERDYRLWHREIARPFVRAGMVASLLAWAMALIVISSFIVGPAGLKDFMPWALFLLFPTILFSLISTYVGSLARWIVPSAALANALAGYFVLGLFFWFVGTPEVASASIVIVAYFAFTVFRLHFSIAAPLVLTHVALSLWWLFDATARGQLAIGTSALYATILLVAFFTGLMICGVLDRVTRQSYQQERLIAAQTVALEHERQRANGLLYSIFPAHIAERLKFQPGIIAEQFEEASVVFADLVGFTPLASTLPPRETVSLLGRIFEAFDSAAAQHGAEKIKTLGDGYMAAVGVPQANAEHAEMAVQFALDLRESLAQVNVERGTGLQVRIGVHSGPLVAGVIGTHKLAYDLWGDTVNVAARMESQGIQSEIQITEATRERLVGKYALRERGVIEVKGKGPMRVWLVDRPQLPDS